MKTSAVTILGAGLIGGSLAGALHGKVKSLGVVDPNPATRKQVQKTGWADRISDSPQEILPGSDLIILAAPIKAILALIPCLPDWHRGQAVVLDLGSTKRQICREMGRLPERFDVVGGHPICGKEQGGFEHADPSIFKGAVFAFSSCGRLSKRAQESAEWVAATVGADPWWVDPEKHDFMLSATSHVPYLLSAALVLNTPAASDPFQGPGYRSATRLAKTPGDMIIDVLFSNRDFIVPRLGLYKRILSDIEEFLQQGNYPALREMCEKAAEIKQGDRDQL